jgi:hypothetical protein
MRSFSPRRWLNLLTAQEKHVLLTIAAIFVLAVIGHVVFP